MPSRVAFSANFVRLSALSAHYCRPRREHPFRRFLGQSHRRADGPLSIIWLAEAGAIVAILIAGKFPKQMILKLPE
jgi:hypothetical protein